MKATVTCAYCGVLSAKEAGGVNRAKRQGAPLYCNRTCAGMARRSNKSKEQKKLEKRLYDMEYRKQHHESLKKKKAAWFKATYDPADAAIKRKERMPRHVEYCRQPKYKQWKQQYDKTHRAKKCYGEFWESAILLNQIEQEVVARMDRTEIYRQNGTLNKWTQRRRHYENLISDQLERCPLGNS